MKFNDFVVTSISTKYLFIKQVKRANKTIFVGNGINSGGTLSESIGSLFYKTS